MSYMTFCVMDAQRGICARRHGSLANLLIPALRDDPETIEELQEAIERFLPPGIEGESLSDWSPGECDTPYDAGICLVDLAGRLIVHQSTYCGILRQGQVSFDDEEETKAPRWIPYTLSADWQVTEDLNGWQGLASQRRDERLSRPGVETRTVLYDRLAAFVVDECFAARGGSSDGQGAWTAPPGWQWRELPHRAAAGQPVHPVDAIAEIHARWLMTPRDDLHGQTPRQLLHAKREEIDRQLQDRQMQWTTCGQPVTPLRRDTAAFRNGGCGTHEIVTYYELVRHIVTTAWELITEAPPDQPCLTREQAIDRLGAIQQDWLATPTPEDLAGRTPAQIIQSERLRVPLCVTHEEAMLDDDCPLCRMLAESGPAFWHLDGCNMDDEFPFALFETTREEWALGRQERAQFDLESVTQHRNGSGDNRIETLSWPESPSTPTTPQSVWQRTFVHSEPNQPMSISLLGVGFYLAELIEDLRRAGQSQGWIDTLNRDFGNLREAAADSAQSLIEPVTASFGEHLLALAEVRPALSAKCLDLQRHLDELAHEMTCDPEEGG